MREEEDDKVFFKSIELKFGISGYRTRRAPINIDDVRTNTLVALSNFLMDRFEIDKDLLEKITPFITSEITKRRSVYEGVFSEARACSR